MLNITRDVLFGKLDPLAYRALEGAASLCNLRNNAYVELVHWLNQILQAQDSDFHRIVRHFGLNMSRLTGDITESLERLRGGSTSVLNISEHVDEAVTQGWMVASLLFGQTHIRTGHLLLGILKTPTLRNILLGISEEFLRVKADALSEQFAAICGGSGEDQSDPADAGSADADGKGATAPPSMGKQEALNRFSIDLTARARNGELDPVRGRDDEIRKIVDVLMRRRQNNPILTGEAGVGKTAVVEGFAQRVAAGDVPPGLKNVSVRSLDLGLLQAGASARGEFQQRLKSVIDEVQLSTEKPIILFIDEAHTLIGAGGAAGTEDAANLLKPALARGQLRTIAATTWAEYKKYIEKDPALTRRFQVVKVDEPSEAKALLMLRGMSSVQEKHHRVQMLDEALEAAVRLSRRYIPDRQLPDKAVSLLDTACARVAVGQHAVPARVEDCRRRIEALEIEAAILRRETELGVDHDKRHRAIEEQLKEETMRLSEMEKHWDQERGLVDRILQLRAKLRRTSDGAIEAADSTPATQSKRATPNASAAAGGATEPPAFPSDASATATAEPATATPKTRAGAESEVGLSPEQRAHLLGELRSLQQELERLQGSQPLILPSVDASAVAAVVADWTGVPVGRMVRNEIDAVMRLADTLEKRVIGQRHALDILAEGVRTSRAGLGNPGKPVGVFMLVGPSGVGKTETALALAEALYGGEHNAVSINMSEFQESHTVSKLLGSPPGYVDSDQGGRLTEAVRRRPYTVLLLDEIEKAHPDVHEVFFQIFQRGWVEDSRGLGVDFRNTIILLTSNVGSDLIMNLCKDPTLLPEPKGLAEAVRAPLREAFSAAFLGRLTVVPYYPIADKILRSIIVLQLNRIGSRMRENNGVEFTYEEAVIDLIASRCTEAESGARVVDAIINQSLLPRISLEVLTRMASGQPIANVHVARQGDGFAFAFE